MGFSVLALIMLWANLADDKLMLFFLFFPENKSWHLMQIVPYIDTLHEMTNLISWEK